MKKTFLPHLLSVVSVLPLAACIGLDQIHPTGKLADPASLESQSSLRDVASEQVEKRWWSSFGDPGLDALIDEGLRGNPELKVVEARLSAARAQAEVAGAIRMPQVAANFSGDRERFPENYIWPPGFEGHFFSQGRVALDFSYELDFWGRNRAVLDAALSYAKAAEIDREAARLMLAVAITRTYVDIDRLGRHQALAEQQLAVRRKAYDLVVARSNAGLDEQAAVARYAAQVAAAEGELAAVQQQCEIVRHQMAALLGAGPDRGLAIAEPHLQESGRLFLPSALPADLLGRRPDIAAQRARVEAADKLGEAARAEFYPNVDLIGFVGRQSLGLPKLQEAGSGIAGFGAAIHLPIYGGGRLRAQLRQRYAEYDAAVAGYNAALTNGLKEIANAVSGWRSIETRDKSQRKVVDETGHARDNARRRYEAGISNELMVIEREFDLLTEQRRAADTRALRFIAAIDLNRALGGGYDPDAKPDATQVAHGAQR